jgi:hypothetical protein
MITGTRDGRMVVWNTENWRPTSEIVAHTAAILSYHIFDDSKFILALSEDRTCSVRYCQRFLVQFLAKSLAKFSAKFRAKFLAKFLAKFRAKFLAKNLVRTFQNDNNK